MRISFLFSKLLDENQGQWYHHQRKFFSGGGKMHHNSAMLTQQMQPPQKLAKRYWLTFSFSLIVVAKAFLILSTPLFLFLTMTEPRCIQGRNLIAKAYFSQYSQNPLESKQFLIFEESRSWPVWEMNSMFHIKSLFCSNLNTLWRPPSFHFILPFNFNWRIVDIRKTWKSKANLMFSFQFCCCCPSSLNKIGVFMASTWNSIGVTTTCKLDQSSSALHLCWAMTIPAARNVTVELRKKWGQFCNSTHTII